MPDFGGKQNVIYRPACESCANGRSLPGAADEFTPGRVRRTTGVMKTSLSRLPRHSHV